MLFEWMEDGLQKEAANKVPLKAIMAASIEFDKSFASFVVDEERLAFAKDDIVAMCHRVASEFGVDGNVVAEHLFSRLAAPMTEVETSDPKKVDPDSPIGGQEGHKYKNWDVKQKNDEVVSDMQDFPYGGAVAEPHKPGSMTGTVTDGPEYDVNDQGNPTLAPYAENTTEKPSFGTHVDMPVADGVSTLSSTKEGGALDFRGDSLDGHSEVGDAPLATDHLHDEWNAEDAHPEDSFLDKEGPEELLNQLLAKGYSKQDILDVLNGTGQVTRPPRGEVELPGRSANDMGGMSQKEYHGWQDPSIEEVAQQYKIDPSVLADLVQAYPEADIHELAIELVDDGNASQDSYDDYYDGPGDYELFGPDRPTYRETVGE